MNFEYISAGDSILKIIKFIFSSIGKIFDIMNSFYIFPGVSYFAFFITFIIMITILSLFYGAIKKEFKKEFNDFIKRDEYLGKHSSEYLAKHGKYYLSRKKGNDN